MMLSTSALDVMPSLQSPIGLTKFTGSREVNHD